jgi:MacB-like periplasmic core domain
MAFANHCRRFQVDSELSGSGTAHHRASSAPLASGVKANEKNSYFFSVSPGWLDTMQIPLLAGRDFRDSDIKPGMAIVNETFARRSFRGLKPVGRTFEVSPSHGEPVQYEVVGLGTRNRLS